MDCNSLLQHLVLNNCVVNILLILSSTLDTVVILLGTPFIDFKVLCLKGVDGKV